MAILLAPRPDPRLMTLPAPLTLALPPTVRLIPTRAPIRWTDDPVTSDVPIRAVHVNELRQEVARLRREAGLAPFAWTDHPAIPWETPIRAAHFLELRAALEQARRIRGLAALPAWSAGSPPSSERVVFASDVNDLRSWAAAAH